MHKFFVKIIGIFILFTVIISFDFCSASQIENVEEKDNSTKEELLLEINECIDEIKKELKTIDKTLGDLDKTEEYEKYPAIRLNIDTPFFGLNSMVDKKLKIKNDVSTVDVAQGYGIKDIINNMSMKLPDFEVGNIVVSTRDVKFDDTISEEDAKICISKLVQYISQTKNTKEILNKRINSIFEGYIPDEKSKKMEDMNKNLEQILSSIIEKDDDILTIRLLNTDENSKALVDKYYDINNQIYNLDETINNVLLNNDELEKIEKNIISLELNTTSFFKDINSEITKLTNDLDIKTLLNNTELILEGKQKDLTEYVDNSVDKLEVNREENNENKEVEIIEISKYEVTSKYILDYEKSLLNNLEQKIKYYIPEISDENTENTLQVHADEKKSVLQDVINLYNDFVEKENKFYLDNLNYMLRDTTYKLAKLPEYTDANTVKDVKYIYITLPEEIDVLFDKYNTKSAMQLEVLTIKLKEGLFKIVDSNIKVNEEYIKFNKS